MRHPDRPTYPQDHPAMGTARNIVSQILEMAGTDVATCQRINDDCDQFVAWMIDRGARTVTAPAPVDGSRTALLAIPVWGEGDLPLIAEEVSRLVTEGTVTAYADLDAFIAGTPAQREPNPDAVCADCGAPVERVDPEDRDSVIHADGQPDDGHTAWVDTRGA